MRKLCQLSFREWSSRSCSNSCDPRTVSAGRSDSGGVDSGAAERTNVGKAFKVSLMYTGLEARNSHKTIQNPHQDVEHEKDGTMMSSLMPAVHTEGQPRTGISGAHDAGQTPNWQFATSVSLELHRFARPYKLSQWTHIFWLTSGFVGLFRVWSLGLWGFLALGARIVFIDVGQWSEDTGWWINYLSHSTDASSCSC